MSHINYLRMQLQKLQSRRRRRNNWKSSNSPGSISRNSSSTFSKERIKSKSSTWKKKLMTLTHNLKLTIKSTRIVFLSICRDKSFQLQLKCQSLTKVVSYVCNTQMLKAERSNLQLVTKSSKCQKTTIVFRKTLLTPKISRRVAHKQLKNPTTTFIWLVEKFFN